VFDAGRNGAGYVRYHGIGVARATTGLGDLHPARATIHMDDLHLSRVTPSF